MQRRGRYHALEKERTILLRCESLEPPMSLVGQSRRRRTLYSGQHEDCSPMHGFEATREVATRRPEGGTESLERPAGLDSERFRSAPRTCERFRGNLNVQ